MIRITDDQGAVGIGLCRSYIEGLLRGERVCVPAGMGAPHVCLFFAEDDDALTARADELWHDGLMPGAVVVDFRKK
jgi:hypothetical protein